MRIFSFFCIIMLLTGSAPFSTGNKTVSVFSLTAEEQAYLETLQERPLVIAYSYDIVQADYDGASGGLLSPLVDILTGTFGLSVETVKVNWHDVFEQVSNGSVDFYAFIAITEARRQQYITVDPFYRSYSKIITRIDHPVFSMLGLYNQSVGLLEGSVMSETMQAYLGPNGRTVYYPTMDDMINGLRSGEITAFATVDNAEFEIMRYSDIQFEFSIDNFFVEQGFISGREDMRMLASILNRYLTSNPGVADEVMRLRTDALLRHSQERLTNEITYLRDNHKEVTLFADPVLYPLCYIENGVIKGMQTEINNVYEMLTGTKVRFGTQKEYPNGVTTALEHIKTGDCMAIVGGYYSSNTANNPDYTFSPLLWSETIRTYSYEDIDGNLHGKTIGAIRCASDYLGWNNTTGNPPVLFNSRSELLSALTNGEIDMAFLGEMRFNYGYTITGDYKLRELSGISAKANMHMIYGAQNTAFNTAYNESMMLYHILNPQSLNEWRSLSNKFKSDYIRMRNAQQIWMMIAIVVFFIMLVALVYLLKRVRDSLVKTKKHNTDLLDIIHYDALTGIYNRRYLDENVNRVVKTLSRSSGMLSLLMLDIDYFKEYNDTYGHNMGDHCLINIAETISKSLLRADDFAARYGGEEFTVVLPNTDEEGAHLIAKRLLHNVLSKKIPHVSSHASEYVTISIGVVTGVVDNTQTADDYFTNADEALYKSKQNGRNRYTFLPMNTIDDIINNPRENV